MYKKILAPLDGSEFSECTLEHLEAVATGCRVPEVVLLMVVEPVPVYYADVYSLGGDYSRDIEKKALDQAKGYLAKVAGNLKKKGIAAQTVVAQGRSADEILDYANKNKVDLIVISTHGRSGVSRWVLGSVADKVIRRSTVPVLIVSPAGCQP